MLIVLDRDGVINYDSAEYIKSPDEWIPLPGSLETIAALKNAGHTVVVATNQSGIGRGYYTRQILSEIHAKFSNLLDELGCKIDGIFYCPHRPEENCDCRKPKPGLFRQIEAKFSPDWSKSVSVGDSLRDLQASQAIGCPATLVRTGNGKLTEENQQGLQAVEVFDDLAHFGRKILSK